jgi:hypothetical protein
LHRRPAAVGELGRDLTRPLCTDGGRDAHRMDHVGEENRDLLVLGLGIAIFDW